MNCASKKIFIHVGYGRTATTLMQNVIFENIPDITYYRKYRPLKMYTRTGDLKYKSEVIEEINKCDPEKPLLFSDEGLIALAPLSQIYNLKDIFPNANIILSIRSQADRILSQYNQLVRRGLEHKGLKAYLGNKRRKYNIVGNNFYLHTLIFLKEVFDGHVEVYIFEQYIKNINLFVKEICGALFNNNQKYNEINNQVSEIDFSQLVIKSRENYSNPSLQHLFNIVRLMNYFKKKMYKKNTMKLITKLDVLLDTVFHNAGRFKNSQRKIIIDNIGDYFISQNKLLEKEINKKLPINYYQ